MNAVLFLLYLIESDLPSSSQKEMKNVLSARTILLCLGSEAILIPEEALGWAGEPDLPPGAFVPLPRVQGYLSNVLF